MVIELVEVIGTTCAPDGMPGGEINGVVLRRMGGLEILRKPAAVEAAQRSFLWCQPPGGRQRVAIVPRDLDGDGQDDAVATVPDDTPTNNLRRLNILAERSRRWYDCKGNMLGSALNDGELWENGFKR